MLIQTPGGQQGAASCPSGPGKAQKSVPTGLQDGVVVVVGAAVVVVVVAASVVLVGSAVVVGCWVVVVVEGVVGFTTHISSTHRVAQQPVCPEPDCAQ